MKGSVGVESGNELFEDRGWTVVRIWECELKKGKYDEKLAPIFKAAAEK